MGWKWRLNHHVSSLSFSLECKNGKLRQKSNYFQTMCHRGTYILNTQVNFRALTEFNDDNRCIYMEVKRQWFWDGHKEHSLSIKGQTNQTWGQRRHLTNADLFASKHTFMCIHTPTSPLPFPAGSPLLIHLSSQPCNQEQTSFHFL